MTEESVGAVEQVGAVAEAASAEFDQAIIDDATKLAKKHSVGEDRILRGSECLAAASLYFVATIRGHDITQDQIANATDFSSSSIHQCHRELLEKADISGWLGVDV